MVAMAKTFDAEVSKRLDQVVAAVERLQDTPASCAKDKALVKWQDNKAKLEKVIFDHAD